MKRREADAADGDVQGLPVIFQCKGDFAGFRAHAGDGVDVQGLLVDFLIQPAGDEIGDADSNLDLYL